MSTLNRCLFSLFLFLSLPLFALQPTPVPRPSEAAFQELKDGNARFARGHRALHDLTRQREKSLEKQNPRAAILACSDSRVAPELVFDQGVGHLFSVRVAGNVAEPATVASVEYAIEHLGVRLVVVLGHEKCGAVKAALETKAVAQPSTPMEKLLALITVGTTPKEEPGKKVADEDRLHFAVRANVDSVYTKLLADSPLIQSYLAKGELKVVPAVYDLSSGLVNFFEAPSQEVAAVPASN